MMIWKTITVITMSAVVVGSSALVAQSQDRPGAARGSAKVKSRFFNPFDVSQSRLTINPFGLVTLAPPKAGARGSASTSESPAILPLGPALTASAAASQETMPQPSTTAGGSGAAELTQEEEEEGGAGAAVRPPFRPPVRSPFRPPPRPPFFPP